MRIVSRLLRNRLAFKLNEFNRSKTYWHGTTEEHVPSIIANGIKAGVVDSYEEGDLTPLDGRVYFAQGLSQAIGYSLHRGSGDRAFVFKIPGSALHDVVLDEDFVDAVVNSGEGPTHPVALDLAVPFPDVDDPLIQRLKDMFYNKRKSLTPKEMVAKIPDELAQELVEKYPLALASDNVIWPTELYEIKVPQRLQGEYEGITPRMLKDSWDDMTVKVTKLTPRSGHTSSTKTESIDFHGLPITVENRRGSTRSGVSPEGERWSREVTADYGSIKRTVGADDEELDVWIGEDRDSDYVLVINQCHPDTGSFDEHKIVIGCGSSDEATALYLSQYPDDWDGILSTKEMSWTEFLDWLDQEPKAFKKVAHPSHWDSQLFKEWFAGSKVLDSSGNPLRVYHGTPHEFEDLDPSKADDGFDYPTPPALYFTSSPDNASGYAGQLDLEWSEQYKPGARVLPVYLHIKNPMEVDAKGENWRDILVGDEYFELPQLVGEAKKLGHDGLIVHNVLDNRRGHHLATTYVVFNPSQVRNAIANPEVSHAASKKTSNPAYDEESKKINESKKSPEAQKRHKFKPAEFTFPNGHPRCLICGDEETEDGMCPGRGKTAADNKPLIDTVVTYVNKSIPKLRSMFVRPLGYKEVEKLLVSEMSIPQETAELLSPLVNQRVDMTLTGSAFRLAITNALTTAPLKKSLVSSKELSATERMAPLEVLDVKSVLGSELEELVDIAFENAVKCHPYAVDKEKADEAFYETLGSSLAVGIDEKYPSKEASEIYQRFRDVGVIL